MNFRSGPLTPRLQGTLCDTTNFRPLPGSWDSKTSSLFFLRMFTAPLWDSHEQIRYSLWHLALEHVSAFSGDSLSSIIISPLLRLFVQTPIYETATCTFEVHRKSRLFFLTAQHDKPQVKAKRTFVYTVRSQTYTESTSTYYRNRPHDSSGYLNRSQNSSSVSKQYTRLILHL